MFGVPPASGEALNKVLTSLALSLLGVFMGTGRIPQTGIQTRLFWSVSSANNIYYYDIPIFNVNIFSHLSKIFKSNIDF